MPEAILSIDRVTKSFVHQQTGSVNALSNISLSVPSGEFLCILGPTGCGKTTLLRMIAGLESPDSGTIRLVESAPGDPGAASVGFVFQQGALFPWATVEANVEFGLRANGVGRPERRARVRELLDLVGLSGFARSYPHQLSGGMQQRVALIRSLATEPELLLLDEPFSALDTRTRHNLEDVVLDLWQATGTTVLFVTHHIEEAVYLSQRLVILGHRPGRIVRDGAVTIDRPRDRLSAAFSEYLLSVRATFEELVDEEKPHS
jgi:NitT/TauT family transport system ATP-binding protein